MIKEIQINNITPNSFNPNKNGNYKHGKYSKYFPKKSYCIGCDKEISNGSKTGRCLSCARKNYFKLHPNAPKKENHPLYNKHRTKETKQKLSEANRLEKHPKWIKGIPIKIGTIHLRMSQLYGKAYICENQKCLGKSKKFDWSNKDHKYDSLDRKDWQQLCRSCHWEYDMKHNLFKKGI